MAKPEIISDIESLQDSIEGVHDSPAFTGIPTAPTATLGTNTNQVATTAFVISEISKGTTAKTWADLKALATWGSLKG